ncbi:DEAD/DEAH box helicase [Nocardioides sp. dk4132]|uniref:DEAD/DEAH box helicase n=1 Tax=unclassified Nocardioides TaxID=2615069 RepID=UPI001296BA20|nr:MULTISPECIES: DEAD/DEAH box helicase [unclassified Nocardioides]MQW74287.1 DEAD/DEAH box helicase [Nocardioides sp. dk4132]QGA06240.1 DEAD/DEAH box helicase [Nocardioides sp. dk884]
MAVSLHPRSASGASGAGPVTGLVERLAAVPGREDRLVHLEALAAREGIAADWPTWADPEVVAAYAARGVVAPWRHQAVAAEAAHEGQHVVLSTGTASGKSLAYQLPALTDIRAARGPRERRGATVLYVAPTKALAQDQLHSMSGLGLDVRITTHDGDSGREQRDWARDYAEYVLTNPDMLHRSLLPGHERWAAFLGSLRYVVIDECHHYRGVFGAHVSHVLRRLRRICAHYGAHPTFVLASATVAEPERAAERLTGLDVLAVTEDTSPRGRLSLALWEPPLTAGAGENGAPVRRAASSETADLLADLVVAGVRTLAFVRSRRGAEQVAMSAAGMLAEVDPRLAGQVAAYRGGYLPEERRAIEDALRRGELTGLAATNALELGIDISGLDAVLIAGFPGTRAALWQQVGRAGRGAQDAIGVLVARDDPLDTYLVHHPEALLGRPVEATVFDPGNPYVLGPHLCAAAQERPLTEEDLPLFGPDARAVVDSLTEIGLLRRRPRGWFWTDRRRAADLADIRSSGGSAVQLVEQDTGRVVGTVDAASSHAAAHPGAVYVHRGETWLVTSLDLEEHVAEIVRAEPDYSTSAREITDIAIVAERQHTSWGPCRLAFGDVEVRHQVVSFLKRRHPSGEVVAEEPLDLPERTLATSAVWWTVPADVLAESGILPADLPGAAHAAEHCSIGLLPLFATCDRWDIGGVSTALHPDTGQLTVFVHDGHPGGAGFAERGYLAARDWLTATRDTIAACGCVEGCPSCIQSPKCGNQNNPLDKPGAVALLDLLLEHAPRAD